MDHSSAHLNTLEIEKDYCDQDKNSRIKKANSIQSISLVTSSCLLTKIFTYKYATFHTKRHQL